MSVMGYRGYKARIDFDPSDEIFVGHLLGINDVVGFHGDTVDGLKAAFHEAVDGYLSDCAKIGKEPEKPFSGRMMFRVDPQVHAAAVLAAQVAGKSLNQWAEEALRRAAEKKVHEGV